MSEGGPPLASARGLLTRGRMDSPPMQAELWDREPQGLEPLLREHWLGQCGGRGGDARCSDVAGSRRDAASGLGRLAVLARGGRRVVRG